MARVKTLLAESTPVDELKLRREARRQAAKRGRLAEQIPKGATAMERPPEPTREDILAELHQIKHAPDPDPAESLDQMIERKRREQCLPATPCPTSPYYCSPSSS